MTFTEKTIEEFKEKFSYIDASECEYDPETEKLDSFAIVGRGGSVRYGLDAVRDFITTALAKQKEEILKAVDASVEDLIKTRIQGNPFPEFQAELVRQTKDTIREAIEKV